VAVVEEGGVVLVEMTMMTMRDVLIQKQGRPSPVATMTIMLHHVKSLVEIRSKFSSGVT
jgi:hypothetical protein